MHQLVNAYQSLGTLSDILLFCNFPIGRQYLFSNLKGKFVGNSRHGYGVLICKDGSEYRGDWQHGMFHGKGRFMNITQNKIEEGVWKEGKLFDQTIN